MKTTPLWTEQFPRPTDLPASPLPERVDVAIVGGGYTGLSAARVLARGGAAAAVLERGEVGCGASSLNAGIAAPGFRQPIEVIFRRYGAAMGHVFWQASMAAIDHIGELIADEGLDCDFRREGHALLAVKPAHFHKMQSRVEWYRLKLGHRLHLVPAATLREEIGSGVYYGGLVDEFSGGLNPAKFVFELARVALFDGAHVCEHTAVSNIEKHPQGYRVHTSRGSLTAQEIIIATNGYHTNLIPGLKWRIIPLNSTTIVTEPLPLAWQLAISPRGRLFIDSNSQPNYFRLTPDGRLLWSGDYTWKQKKDLTASARRLQAQMLRVFPDLEKAMVTHAWRGKIGMTLDWMPHIGHINGIHYAAGYGGHGLALAAYMGAELGQMLCGQISSSVFSEIRHPGMLYAGRPWFMPFANLYHRIRRRLV